MCVDIAVTAPRQISTCPKPGGANRSIPENVSMAEDDRPGSPAPRRPTLAQVAAAAGVSLKTASRVLAGEPHVREETRRRVLAHAQQLGYQRNSAASLLAAGRSVDYIGVITGDLTNPFYAGLAQGIEDGARDDGLHVSIASSAESPEAEWSLAQGLASQRCQAIIVVSAMEDHACYQSIRQGGTPVVFVDRRARGLDADSVVLDNVTGGRLAAEHLLGAGHRRIAYVGDFEWLPTQRDRIRGFGAAMERSGVEQWRSLVRSDAHDATSARKVAAELLDGPHPPTALVAGNNRSALGLLQELSSRHPRCGGPALVGFDDVEWAEVVGLTVIAHDPVEMGRRAARLAIDRLGAREREAETVVLPVSLVVRGSGERPAG